MTKILIPLRATALALAVAGTLFAAYAGDIFDFIPLGGRSLLANVLAGRKAEDIQAVVSAKRTRDEWVTYLRGRSAQLPAVQRLSDKQMLTLADYMSFNIPLPAGKAPSASTQAAWEKALPMDGRDMSLEYCQGCHIITVVITQDRTKQAWLGSLNKPSHVGIKLNAQQRDALTNYLVLNAAIPIEQVPEDLRAGGATY
jgi:mono/diheme cytochrome c family protein